MICPQCGGPSQVIDSRPAKNDVRSWTGAQQGTMVWRRRVCMICATRFETMEKLISPMDNRI